MPSNNGNNDFWLAAIAVASSMLYAIKNYDEFAQHSKWVRFRKLLYGMFGSAVTVWTAFELLLYMNLPDRLCLALSGMLGYLGSEVVSRLIIGFIEAKFIKKANE